VYIGRVSQGELTSDWLFIVTICKVVFANKSRKLGWIWMVLGRWGWGLKRLIKPCTFPAKSRYGFRRAREKNGSQKPVVFLWRKRRTTSTTFLRSISAKISANTCPGGGSQHMVSNSRKVSGKRSNFPKNRLFRVQKGTLFVPRLRVAGNVHRRLDCFHPRVDIHRCALQVTLLRDVPFSSYPRPHVFESCATV